MTARTIPISATRGDHATVREMCSCTSMCLDMPSLCARRRGPDAD